ncbi:TRDN protein, partial [Polypterus senegalus]
MYKTARCYMCLGGNLRKLTVAVHRDLPFPEILGWDWSDSNSGRLESIPGKALGLVIGRAYATTTTVIDAKNGSISKLSEKTPKKSVADDLAATFSSPAAWLLVVALIFTWSAVAIVMFDLVDYKSYVDHLQFCRYVVHMYAHEDVSSGTSETVVVFSNSLCLRFHILNNASS